MDPEATLASEVHRLRGEVAELRAELHRRDRRPSRGSEREGHSAPTGRRAFVRRAGMMAAATVAGAAAALAGSDSASAAGPLTTDTTGNMSTSPTGLAVLGTNVSYGLGVTDNGLASLPPLTENSAILGHAKGNNSANFFTGVTGYIEKTGIGVFGYASGNGTGVVGRSFSGSAVEGFATAGIAGTFVGGTAALLLGTFNPPPQQSSKPNDAGEIDADYNGDVWFCAQGGTPGTWRKLAGLHTAGAFHVLPSTVRVYDSRASLAPTDVAKGKIDASADRVVDMTHMSSGVPLGATAVMVNLTIADTGSAGYLALFKNGISWPGNSSINWDHASQVSANLAVVAVDATPRSWCTAWAKPTS